MKAILHTAMTALVVWSYTGKNTLYCHGHNFMEVTLELIDEGVMHIDHTKDNYTGSGSGTEERYLLRRGRPGLLNQTTALLREGASTIVRKAGTIYGRSTTTTTKNKQRKTQDTLGDINLGVDTSPPVDPFGISGALDEPDVAVFYDNPQGFEAAAANLVNPVAFRCEDFENSLQANTVDKIGPCDVASLNDAVEGDACYATGELTPGFTVSSDQGNSPIATATDWLNAKYTTTWLLFWEADGTGFIELDDNDIHAVCFDYANFWGDQACTIGVYDAEGTHLGGNIYLDRNLNPGFVSFVSPDVPIKKITINAGPTFEAIDNLCFGSPSYVQNSAPVPGDTLPHGDYRGGVVIDDPHFKTWSGKWYDFMGACDLIFVEAPHFAADMALRIHIRTKIRYVYSYISNAVLQIGDDVLEVASFGEYRFNGVAHADLSHPDSTLGDGLYHVQYTHPSPKVHLFEIVLGMDDDEGIQEKIVIKTFKDMVSVKLEHAGADRFADSVGMMGDFMTGDMMARNGTTVVDDPNLFAAEWQVRSGQSLFQGVASPQYPDPCELPPTEAVANRRRLSEGVSSEDAKLACADWPDDMRAGCMYDTMATGDLELAMAGAF